MELFSLLLLVALVKDPPAAPINVNTATVEQLQTLPGVGPSTAKSIVRHRDKNGPFRRVDDLLILKGMSRQRLQKLRPYVKVK